MTDTTTKPQNTSPEEEWHPNEGDERPEEAVGGRSASAKRGGPKTPAGKKAVSQNAITHGITSPSPVAGGEDPTEWEEFKRGWHEYFKPVGVPEEEIVDFLAITSWRKRRIVRREVAYIDARHHSLKADISDSFLPAQTSLERRFEECGCDVAAGIHLLETLDGLDSDCELEDESSDALALVFFCGLDEPGKISEDDETGSLDTAGLYREWIAKLAAAENKTYEIVVQRALLNGREVLARQTHRNEEIERIRLARERASVMPSVQEMDSLVRYEAHMDRSFARGMSQLELLQRTRSGEHVPPPERVEVTVQ